MNPEEGACIALYFSGTPPSTDILGPTTVRDIPGKGRGLVATRALAAGELVMAVQPLAVLHGPQDVMPSPDSLVEHLRTAWPQLQAEQRRALADMHTGRSDSGASSASAAAGASTPSPSTSASVVDGVDLRSVVAYNAYGDEYEDLAAADLRSTDSSTDSGSSSSGVQSHVGLWPHFARLNHACAPNCVHYVVGATMLVRAVQAIAEGAELEISYLGRDDFAPRQVRQAVLQSRYGFRCGCARCRTEEQLPEELAALLLQLHDRARGDLAPRFERLASAAAVDATDGAIGVPVEVDDEEDDEDVGRQGPAFGADASALASSSGGMTAAEAAKRALRKASGASPQPQPEWPALLAALEPRLDEAARQLHLALKELQEDDDAADEEDKEGDEPAGPTALASRRPMTRVQTAQAAAYQLLELLHLHAELSAAAAGGMGSSPRASAALAACWHVLDAISRGSELQVFQACKLLTDAMRASRHRTGVSAAAAAKAAAAAPEGVRDAAALLGQSLLARYGRLRGPHLTRMTQAAMRASRTFF